MCGCETIVMESIRVDRFSNAPLVHSNGTKWEEREFACGFRTGWIPNFCRENSIAKCRKDPEEAERLRKEQNLKQAILHMIENSDVSQSAKERFATGIQYR